MPGCEHALIELERRGYEVWRVGGYANIDMGRSEMATKALGLGTQRELKNEDCKLQNANWEGSTTPSSRAPLPEDEGFEETFWIDSDIEFEPDAVDRIRSHGLPICCGIYARKGARATAAHTLPGTTKLGMGKGSGLIEFLYAGTGFLHVRREVYTAIREKLALPMCNAQFGRPMVPFFMPMIVPWEPPSPPAPLPKGEGRQCWYLADDYSFCERARQCGYKIMADTSIRLWHIGQYAYGWEDAGQERVRHDSFLFMLADGKKK